MTKFKLVIEAEIELTEEASAIWTTLSDADKAEYFATFHENLHGAVGRELDEDEHSTRYLNVEYTEAV